MLFLRRQRSLRSILICCLGLVIFGVVYLSKEPRQNVCKLQDSVTQVCQFYGDGVITGNLCPELCKMKTLKLSRCLSPSSEYQVYEGHIFSASTKPPDTPVLLKQYISSGTNDYSKPSEGSKLEDLKVMISAYLKLKLGEGSFEKIESVILNTADFDNDGEVSLAEAKSIWALLHNNEFLMTMVLKEVENIPKFKGFCGDIFVTEALSSYDIHQSSFVVSFFVGSRLSWANKARIAVGILEFVEEILDHPATGNLMLCNLNEKSIGFTKEHEAKLHSLQWIATETVISSTLQKFTCERDAECVYGYSCHSECSAQGSCSGQLMETNLQQTCKLLHMYLEKGAPSNLYADLDRLLDRCLSLNKAQQRIHLEHSVVLNDLRNMLWREISMEKNAK